MKRIVLTIMMIIILSMNFVCVSKAATVAPCKSPYATQFINNEDGTITKICTQSSVKWIQIYNEQGSEIFAQQFLPSGNEWVLKEQYITAYKENGVTTDNKEHFFLQWIYKCWIHRTY